MTQEEYQALIKEIKHHDDLYFNQSQPEITDTAYDELYFQLQDYESKNPTLISPESPTQTLATTTQSASEIAHPYPLLSLKKANTMDAVATFMDKFEPIINPKTPRVYQTDSFMLQLKEDGLTIVMYFNWFDDRPFVAATRGGGIKGQDVSRQLQTFAKYADKIKEPMIVRGEVILKNKDFEAMNQDGLYMNPRNAVSGLIHKDAVAENITFIAYNIENAEEIGIQTESEMLSKLTDYGFTTPELQVVFDNNEIGREDVLEYIKTFEDTNQRLTLDHDIDGLVIKPNYIANRRQLGFTSHHPRNQLAYKFTSPDAITILRDVVWQNGAKGRLTPVGVFDTVTLMGANISKASLASYGNIVARDIMIGDTILVRRSNDVIPQIVKSYPEKRTGTETPIQIPANAVAEGEFLYSDQVTDDQRLNQWQIFIGKEGLDIKKVSIKTIKDLAENHLIQLDNFATLWNVLINTEALQALKGWSDLKINNLVSQLSKPLPVTMEHLLYGLAIRGLGHHVSQDIAAVYPTITALLEDQPVSDAKMLDVQVMNRLHEYDDVLKQLAPHLDIKTPIKASGKLSGKSFVITGAAQNKSRNEVKALINDNGGKVASSVSKNVDYLIELTPDSTSSKSVKAHELNVPVITESEFDQMIK